MAPSNTEPAKQIGSHLQTMRRAAGFKSAKTFAEHIGISKDTYTGYEQGRISLSYERAWEFADALGCTLDDIGGRKFPGKSLSPDEESLVSTYRSVTPHGKKAMMTNAKAVGEEYRSKSDMPEMDTP